MKVPESTMVVFTKDWDTGEVTYSDIPNYITVARCLYKDHILDYLSINNYRRLYYDDWTDSYKYVKGFWRWLFWKIIGRP